MYSLISRQTKVTETWAGPGNKAITCIHTEVLLMFRSYGQGQGIEFDFIGYRLANLGISNELGIVCDARLVLKLHNW